LGASIHAAKKTSIKHMGLCKVDPRTVQLVGSRYTDYATRPDIGDLKGLKGQRCLHLHVFCTCRHESA